MRKLKGLTRIDAAVALACIALLLAQAGVINAGGRERSKREVCLANLRMLTAAWQAYADDNSGKLVNGGPTTGDICPDCPSSKCGAVAPTGAIDTDHTGELPWIGNAYGSANDCCMKCAVTTGALWKYINDFSVYCCPVTAKGQVVTYSVVDGMNGLTAIRGNVKNDGVWMKNTNQIVKPASRFAFIDEGRISPDSYGVIYNGGNSSSPKEMWFDPPPVQHTGGTCISFADGHSTYHKWNSQETISIGISGAYMVTPATCDGKNDLYWVQIGCWGKLGYTPTCPINIE
jgi:hypothetical protein